MPVSERDRDLIIRTVIGEAGNEPDEGKAAVAHVILNRVASGRWGKTAGDVVLAKGQFEPWATRRRELLSYAPDSRAYKATGSVVDKVLAGEADDPTGGRTHFYSPGGQRAMGRRAPEWDDGSGLAIGGHLFFAPEGPVKRVAENKTNHDDFLSQWGVVPSGKGKVETAPPASGGSHDDFLKSWGIGSSAATLQGSLDAAAATKREEMAKPALAKGDRLVPKVGPDFKPAGDFVPAKTRTVGGRMGVGAREVPVTVETPLKQQWKAAVGGMIEGVPIAGPALLSARNKASALLRSQMTGKPYEEALGEIERETDAAFEANPGTRIGGNIAGGVIATGPFAATKAGATALGITGKSIWNRMLAGGATGATVGTLDATARGEDPGAGAAIGGAFGTFAPAAGKVIGATANRLLGWVGKSPTTEAAATRSALAASREGIPPPDFRAAFADNPRLRPVDVSDAVFNRAQGIAVQPGEGRAVLVKAAQDRAGSAPAAVTQTLDNIIAPVPDVKAYLDGLKATARRNAQQGFGAALQGAKPVDISGTLKFIDDTVNPGVTGVTSPGSKLPLGPREEALMRVRGMIANDTERLTDAERLHVIQANIRRDAETLSKSANGQDRLVAKALGDVRAKLNADIDAATGGKFSKAQKRYKDDVSVDEAFDHGLTIFRNRSGEAGLTDRPEYWRDWMANASKAEKAALRQGVRVAADQAIGSVRNAALKGEALVAPELNQAKLRIVLGKKEADRLAKLLGDEMKMARVDTGLLGGSQTAARREAAESTRVVRESPPLRDAMKTTLTGLVTGVPIKGAETAIAGGRGAFGSARNRIFAEAASEAGGAKFMDMIDRGMRAEQRRLGISRAAGVGSNLLLSSAGTQGNRVLQGR